jgi:hypothetical protein
MGPFLLITYHTEESDWCALCTCLSLCTFSGTFSATVLLIMYNLGWCSLCPCFSSCESTGTFFATVSLIMQSAWCSLSRTYHCVNLQGPFLLQYYFSYSRAGVPFSLTYHFLKLWSLFLLLLIIVCIWWALSPFLYHSVCLSVLSFITLPSLSLIILCRWAVICLLFAFLS